MKKKFIIEFDYKSEEDIDFKYALEGAIDNMLYDCLEVGQISDFDITQIEEVEDKASYINLSELVSKINCRNCRFDIYVYPSQESVVCGHCGTHNNLRVEFNKDKLCLDCCNYNIGDGIEDLEYCKRCKK